MNLVKKNPYRIIGVLTGVSYIQEKKDHLNLKEGNDMSKDPYQDYGFPVLGSLDRLEDERIQAQSNLVHNRKRLEASLFWFYCGNVPSDDLAFASLAKGELMGALDVWLNMTLDHAVTLTNASAFNNLGTLYLSGALDDNGLSIQNLQQGITLKLKYLESYFFHGFVKLATDGYFKISRNDLERVFLWKLMRACVVANYMRYEEFVSVVLECSFSAKQDFLYEVIKDVQTRKRFLFSDPQNDP